MSLEDLIHKLLDDRLTGDEQRQLEQLLTGEDGEEARRTLFKYVDVQLAIAERAEFESCLPEELTKAWPASLQDAADDLPAVRPQENEPLARLRRRSALAMAAAAAVVLAMIPFVASDAPQVAEDPGTDEAAPPSAVASPVAYSYVAELGAVSPDVVWSDDASPHEFLLRLRPDDVIELEAGFVEVEYFSGAKLILRGPCRFIATGEDSGHLVRGEVTGEVSVGDFLLRTPTAQVVDLGTRFGARIDADSNTEVCVFEGKVRLASANRQGVPSKNTILLTEGMAARAKPNGRIDVEAQIDQESFAQSVPLPPSLIEVGKLSLVDVMNGYEEGRYRLAAGIEPDTGSAYQQASLAQQKAFPRPRRGVYHVTSWHPAIDGVFIPPRHGKSVQVDSSGGTIDLPPNGAVTSGPVWSRRRIEDSSRIVFHENFWGGGTLKRVLRRLENCEWGMIGLHANAGITFDLHAIRQQYGKTPVRFEVILANLDNSDEHESGPTIERRFTADCRVFVDGQLRRSRLGFGRTDGDMKIVTRLAAGDRFLTIATSDAGHYWYDQVGLIDPALILETQAASIEPPAHGEF